jgi:hypothetical protein
MHLREKNQDLIICQSKKLLLAILIYGFILLLSGICMLLWAPYPFRDLPALAVMLIVAAVFGLCMGAWRWKTGARLLVLREDGIELARSRKNVEFISWAEILDRVMNPIGLSRTVLQASGRQTQ